MRRTTISAAAAGRTTRRPLHRVPVIAVQQKSTAGVGPGVQDSVCTAIVRDGHGDRYTCKVLNAVCMFLALLFQVRIFVSA